MNICQNHAFPHNWNTKSYDLGTGYGHIAIGVKDIYQTCNNISSKGGNIIREPGAMKHSDTLIAFIQDPDGYKIELIEIASRKEKTN